LFYYPVILKQIVGILFTIHAFRTDLKSYFVRIYSHLHATLLKNSLSLNKNLRFTSMEISCCHIVYVSLCIRSPDPDQIDYRY
jgi:hypothetical protein